MKKLNFMENIQVLLVGAGICLFGLFLRGVIIVNWINERRSKWKMKIWS